MTTLIEAKNLSHHFDLGRGRRLRAVDCVSLAIEEGEVLGLVGESGSGKSTFGKTLIGLLDKTGGTVSYRQEALPKSYSAKDYKRNATRMQMIFQDPYSSLNTRMTIAEIISEGLYLTQGFSRRSNAEDVREQVAFWLQKVGLSPDHMSRYPHEFSGGQRQRIGIARVVALKPEFIVCDEPISALDVSVQAQIINLLNDLTDTMNITLLFIAHDLSMVRYVSNRMAVLYLGALMEVGAADDLYFRPMHPYTQLLVQSSLEPDPAYERGRQPTLIRDEIPLQVDVPGGCRFAGRCPKAMPVCNEIVPMPIVVQDDVSGRDRQVTCHLYGS